MNASPGRTGRLSAHFTASELACRHCGACIVRDELVGLLEAIRAHAGHPLMVRDAYRCPIHNAEVGGASDSRHMYGEAADIPTGVIRPAAAHALGARGVGVKAGWAIHVDVRPHAVADWSYT